MRWLFRDGRSFLERVALDTFPREGLVFASNMDFYMNHLWFLGLAGTFESRAQEPTAENGRQLGSIEYREYRLTDLGDRFASAVLTSKA